MTNAVTRRILARARLPGMEASELDCIENRVRILNETFSVATRRVQELIDNGTLIVVREEPLP